MRKYTQKQRDELFRDPMSWALEEISPNIRMWHFTFNKVHIGRLEILEDTFVFSYVLRESEKVIKWEERAYYAIGKDAWRRVSMTEIKEMMKEADK